MGALVAIDGKPMKLKIKSRVGVNAAFFRKMQLSHSRPQLHKIWAERKNGIAVIDQRIKRSPTIQSSLIAYSWIPCVIHDASVSSSAAWPRNWDVHHQIHPGPLSPID